MWGTSVSLKNCRAAFSPDYPTTPSTWQTQPAGKHTQDLQKHYMNKKGQVSVRLRDQYKGVCLCAALLGKLQPCAKRPCSRANDIMICEQIFSQTRPPLGAFVSLQWQAASWFLLLLHLLYSLLLKTKWKANCTKGRVLLILMWVLTIFKWNYKPYSWDMWQ